MGSSARMHCCASSAPSIHKVAMKDADFTIRIEVPPIDIRLHTGQEHIFEHVLDRILDSLHSLKELVMTSTSEAIAKLDAVLAQQQKTATEIDGVQTEVTALKAQIADLQAVIAAGNDNVSPELSAKIDAIAAQAQVVDDKIPDVPVA